MSNEITIIESNIVEEVGLSATKEKYEAIESDLNEIQQNMQAAVDKITAKLDNIIDFADAAQHHHMYNALAKVIQSFAQLNKETALIVKQKQELYDSFRAKKVNETAKEVQSITNNIDNRQLTFEGTSTDILDRVLSRRGDTE